MGDKGLESVLLCEDHFHNFLFHFLSNRLLRFFVHLKHDMLCILVCVSVSADHGFPLYVLEMAESVISEFYQNCSDEEYLISILHLVWQKKF